jgi:hypothetical protein
VDKHESPWTDQEPKLSNETAVIGPKTAEWQSGVVEKATTSVGEGAQHHGSGSGAMTLQRIQKSPKRPLRSIHIGLMEHRGM